MLPADVVVHCASSGADSYRHVYPRRRSQSRCLFPSARLIFTSTPAFIRIATEVPSPKTVQPNPLLKTHRSAQAEKIILDHHGIVLRVAGIYGPGDRFTTQCDDRNFRHQAITSLIKCNVTMSLGDFFLARSRAVDPPRIFNVVDDTPAREAILDCYRRGSGSPFKSPATARQNAGHSHKRVGNAKCARSAGSQPIPVIAKGLIVRPSASKAANPPIGLF